MSNSTELLDELNLSTLLLQSRRDNVRMGITGVLLCLHGQVFQVLEGERQVLTALYQRIQQDSRHSNITTVFNSSIKKRLFTAWCMGYQTLTASQLEEITVIVNLEQKKGEALREDETLLLNLAKTFYDCNCTL